MALGVEFYGALLNMWMLIPSWDVDSWVALLAGKPSTEAAGVFGRSMLWPAFLGERGAKWSQSHFDPHPPSIWRPTHGGFPKPRAFACLCRWGFLV